MKEIASRLQNAQVDGIKSTPLRQMVSTAKNMDSDSFKAWQDSNWQQWRGDYSDMSPW